MKTKERERVVNLKMRGSRCISLQRANSGLFAEKDGYHFSFIFCFGFKAKL